MFAIDPEGHVRSLKFLESDKGGPQTMGIDLDAYRQQSRETWGLMAPGWEDRREWLLGITGAVNAWLVERVDPQPGETMLDIAAGAGDLGLEVAERVGDEGRVILSDFAS